MDASLQAEAWSPERLSLAITQRVADSLYSLRAQLAGLAVAEVARQGALDSIPDSEALMPLILEQMDDLQHSWTQPSHLRKVGSKTRHLGFRV